MTLKKPKQGYKLVKSLFGKYEEIPEEWDVDEIQYFAKIETGNKNTQDKIKDGKYPFFVRSKKVERINSFSYDGEAVLTAGDGDIGKIFHYVQGKFDFHQRVYKISDFNVKLDGYFFYLYFGKYFLKRAKSMSAKNTVDSIRQEMISKMPIMLPPINQQQKIASILSNIDNLISLYDEIMETTKNLETGMTKHLLTKGINHKKFKKIQWYYGKKIEIPEEWAIKSLSTVAKIQRGAFSHRPRDEPKFYGGQYPFIQINDVEKSDGYITKFSQTLNELGLSISKLIPKNCILLSIIANIGSTAISSFPVCINDNLVGITSEKMNIIFLRLILKSRKSYLNNIAPQSAQKSINLEILKPLLIQYPSLDEQNQIGNIIKNMEMKILDIKTKRNHLLDLKKGLMQTLLTGQIRVSV